ncbi:MAG: hypothetical protein IJO16_06770 [Clostridia bacterium]|nr:hypothetical protein [Clostridia bacterium]
MLPFKTTDKYDDIINMPHQKSVKHPQMSMINRAAQFSPFAALTGHGEAIKETARLTDERIELDESVKAVIDERLQYIEENIKSKPTATVTYFEPDDRKEGGEYVTVTGKVGKIDRIINCIIMTNGMVIPICEIFNIEGEKI